MIKYSFFFYIMFNILWNSCKSQPKIEYYDNGDKKSEIEYKEGKKNGKAIYWYENGNKQMETMYANNMIIDYCIKWYENGKIESETRNMRIDTIMYPDTLAEDVINYVEKLVRSENTVFYYKNSNKNREETFLMGKKNGVWKYWNEDGNLIKEETYDNGKLIKTKEY